MLDTLIAATIFFILLGFLARKPLRFALYPTIEVEAHVVNAIWTVDQDAEGHKWEHYRCKLEYTVDGRVYDTAISRKVQPEVGDIVTLVFPKGRPTWAIEGKTKDIPKYLVKSIILIVILLVLIQWIQATKVRS